MGKHNTVDAEWLDDNYDYFDANGTDRETGWYQAYRRFNAFGTFDNKFTDQLGLDGFTPAPQTSGDGEGEDDDTADRETQRQTPRDQVAGTTDGDDGRETTVSGGTPGLGVLAGLAGVGTGAYLLDRGADGGEAGTPAEPSPEGQSAPGAGECDDDADRSAEN
jgi:hypothetical protein